MSVDVFRAALVDALDRAGVSTDAVRCDEAVKLLASHYGEPLRAYHNCRHIVSMLDELAKVEKSPPPALTLAIVYHDVIYDPRRHDNEAASALLARSELAKLGLPPELIERSAELILATQHGASVAAPADRQADLLIDLDLAILGSEEQIYRVYAESIRTEYAHVPSEQYRAGRARLLQAFLDRVEIFRTADFRACYETRARANLRAEIASLTAQ